MSRPARILFLQHVANLGGSAWSLLQLMDGLDPARFTPIVGLRADGPLAEACRRRGWPVMIHPDLRPLVHLASAHLPLVHPANLDAWLRRGAGQRAAAALVRQAQPDLVHVNSSVLVHLAAGARAAGAQRIVLHIREHWPVPASSRVGRACQHIARTAVDQLVAITRTDAEQFGQAARTAVIHNWPDFAGRDEEVDLHAVYGIPPGVPIVLALAGRNPIKGGLVLAEALLRLRHPTARFLLVDALSQTPSGFACALRRALESVGLRTYGMKLDRAAARSGGRLILAAATPSIRSLMQQAAVVACPFTQPHFAKAAVEAGLLGRPVVLSDGGEARETVRPGETGLLVLPGDATALAAALDQLLADPAEAQRMGAAARNWVEATFSRARSLEHLQRIYGDLLARP